jgi:hypothetical protein
MNHYFDSQMLYMNMNSQVFFVVVVCSAATAEIDLLSQLEL